MRYLFLLAVFALLVCTAAEDSLYDALGIRRSASQAEIRKAYKKMAREWHPDKNSDPDATQVFTKINEAYETLGDAKKRQQYDDFGYTSANSRQPSPQQHGGFQGFPGGFFRHDGFGFNFNENFGGESTIDKHLITLREYQTKVLPNSNRKPCVIYVFTDFCFNCMRVEGIIEKLMQELTSVGMCAAAVHAGRARDLSSHLRITEVPTIIGLVNERVSYYRGVVSSQGLRDFARNLFPPGFVLKITDANVKEFLDGWSDNRVRAIFFSHKDSVAARFLAPAFYYKHNVASGYVYTYAQESQKLISKYNVNRNRETLLMFNEETNSPVATISMQQLPRSTLDEVIEANKHLMLPRISSEAFFDDLCPTEFKVRNRKLCVVLMTKQSPDHDSHRDTFRQYSQRSTLAGNERVKFTYVYEDTQQDFVHALLHGKSVNKEKALPVVILWRIEKQQLSYELFDSGWDPVAEDTEDQYKKLKSQGSSLDFKLNILLTTEAIMPYRANKPQFFNEHGYGLLKRIGLRLWSWGEKMISYANVHDSMTWITLGLSVMFVVGMGYFMHRLATLEEEQIKHTMPRKTKARPPSRTFDLKSLQMYELRSNTYTELVSEADTGLTFTVLVDKDSKDKLIQKFGKIVHPYSRYSALTFSFLQLEYYIGWYKSLLEESMEDIKLENINIKNCVGTVIALNGYRKYYYIYSVRKARKFIRERNQVSQALGLDDLDEVSEGEDDYFFLDEVLDGLSIWMDKIFDGSMKRIRITKWPEMTE